MSVKVVDIEAIRKQMVYAVMNPPDWRPMLAEALDELEVRRSRAEKAEADSWCDVCCGKGTLESQRECICGGTGKAASAVINLRVMLHKAKAEKATNEGAIRIQASQINNLAAEKAQLRRSLESALDSIKLVEQDKASLFADKAQLQDKLQAAIQSAQQLCELRDQLQARVEELEKELKQAGEDTRLLDFLIDSDACLDVGNEWYVFEDTHVTGQGKCLGSGKSPRDALRAAIEAVNKETK